MKISIPNIPSSLLNAPKALSVSLDFAVERVADFLRPGNVVVLTGAGVSVDSGIRAYRGEDGRYMNPKYRPIFYHELVDNSPRGHLFRQRYWSRSYLGYPLVRRARANPAHFALAALLRMGHVNRIITQNVDGLHLKASSLDVESDDEEEEEESRILQLHGTLHQVHCRMRHVASRSVYQSRLSVANPRWKRLADDFERTGTQPRTNPDGDVELQGVRFDDFVVPPCEVCLKGGGMTETVMKPSVIFFGESIPDVVRDRSFASVEESDRLLVVGTTLATYSAFRLVKHAVEMLKPVLLINMGPTRADGLAGIEKLEVPSSTVLNCAARALTSSTIDPEVEKLLTSGAVTELPVDDANTVLIDRRDA